MCLRRFRSFVSETNVEEECYREVGSGLGWMCSAIVFSLLIKQERLQSNMVLLHLVARETRTMVSCLMLFQKRLEKEGKQNYKENCYTGASLNLTGGGKKKARRSVRALVIVLVYEELTETEGIQN